MESKKQIGATIEEINKWYDDALAYQKQIGITQSIPESVRFYQGDQWEKATKDTKFFPRPVVNIIEMSCNNKKSQVLSSPIRIVYKNSRNNDVDVERFNHFADYELARLRQDEFNNKAILDGIIKGSWCFYYYWDKDVVGADGLIEGDIGLQLIDPINVLFANPTEKDEQKQEWIMLISRENIEKIRKMADEGVDSKSIVEDSSDSIYNEEESDTTKFATVITRFFRVDGEVYYERATKGVIFNRARPFTPDVKKFKKVLNKEEVNSDDEQQPKSESNRFVKRPKATLYPIVFSSWKDRDKSIYGRGEVEAIIPNQKAINWTLGLQILMAQNEGMSPVIVSHDALRGQKITNEPGQIITDYSKGGNGIKFPNKPSMSGASVGLVDKIADLTRVAIGSSEVMNGEVISSGMSGAAIAQLQAQALKPIQDLQKNFWRSMKRVGEVLEQFLKFFFNGKKYQYRDKNDNVIEDSFDSSTYKNASFDVLAEAVAGTIMSDVADINLLETLLAKGAISNKQYIECYPDNAIANKQKIIECLEESEKSQISQMAIELQQVQAQLEQAQKILTAQEQTINNASSVITENRTLKEKLYSLQAEYTQKMQQANQILYGIASKSKEYKDDAALMANEIAERRGLKSSQKQEQLVSGNPSEML